MQASLSTPELSRSVEDYLADIYRMQDRGGPVKTGDLAVRLGVTPASVSGMFKWLAKEGLITYKEYTGAKLTRTGEKAAIDVIRRHRVLERFLTDILGLAWERVDMIAQKMEHTLPDEVVDAMEQHLGDPETCPHGHPIPHKNGTVISRQLQDLTTLKAGDQVTISEVDEFNADLLHYFYENGLIPGAHIEIESINPIDNTLICRVNEKLIAIGPVVARAILVRVEPNCK